MDSYRQIPGQDYGILRKKEGKEEELFVFGYSCKIYEDYEKSLYVDQGKHLIPWLGDETLKIDRYDCRGALHDLVPYLPKSEGFDRLVVLSNEEKRIEALCDQERFRALEVNEDEELLYQEEELKRLQRALSSEQSYSEVGFSYNNDSQPPSEEIVKETPEEEEEEPFIPPYQLDVPVGMKIPKSRKHHEIIEKTAFFIHDQGAQMEILLKMKQADNPQFNFLSFDGELHPYYRHMMAAVKNGRYKSTVPAPVAKVVESPTEPANDENYLHPSLAPRITTFSLPESAPKIPTISYKPSVDCTYSALVNRIKESQNANRDGATRNVTDLRYPVNHINADGTKSGAHPSTDSYDNAGVMSTSVPLSALTKSARRRRIRREKNEAAAALFKIYYADEQVTNQADETPRMELMETESETNLVEHDRSTNSDDDDDDDAENSVPLLKPVPAPVPVLQIPPPDMQLIIDKMASYVAKNGRDFEEVVRSKGDPRFSFLGKEHVYNPFYNQKVELYLQLENPELTQAHPVDPVKNKKHEPNATVKRLISKVKSSRSSKPIPICFSIKKPKDQEALEIKSALPCEESEGEHDEGVVDDGEKDAEKSEENAENTESDTAEPATPPMPEKHELSSVAKPSEMTLEKWAQERLLAKWLTAAKEKLAAKEKDKQLQAERRKKAAEFINLLHKEHPSNRAETPEDAGTNAVSNGKKDSSDVITIPSDSSSDSDSVVSVPLSGSDEEKRNLKRKCEPSDSLSKRKERKECADDRSKHRKSKHRSHSSSRTRSPSYSRHSSRSKYKKYDKEKKSHSKKKKRHHYQNSSSSSYKESHKGLHKSKRSRCLNDNNGSGVSEGGSGDSSGSEATTRLS